MLSRTLSLATVTLLIAGLLAAPALAQNQNLEAGKSPSQIFAGTCTACHKGPRGLLKTVAPGSLQGFLRQHYTTSPEMASLLAGFLVSNGAADVRHVVDQPRSGRGEKPETKPGSAPDQTNRFGRRMRTAPPLDAAKLESEPRDGSKPVPDGVAEHGRQGRSARRSVRPEEPEGQTPAQLSNERGTTKQKLSKRNKPSAEEPAKSEAAKPDTAKEEPAKIEAGQGDTPKSDTASETAKSEGNKSEGNKSEGDKSEQKDDSNQAEGTKVELAKPSVDSGKSEGAGVDIPSESRKAQAPASGPDPVTSSQDSSPAVTSATAEPSAAPPAAEPTQSLQPSQAVAISAPPTVAPTGPPVPPISR
jgi:hypothetical protein